MTMEEECFDYSWACLKTTRYAEPNLEPPGRGSKKHKSGRKPAGIGSNFRMLQKVRHGYRAGGNYFARVKLVFSFRGYFWDHWGLY